MSQAPVPYKQKKALKVARLPIPAPTSTPTVSPTDTFQFTPIKSTAQSGAERPQETVLLVDSSSLWREFLEVNQLAENVFQNLEGILRRRLELGVDAKDFSTLLQQRTQQRQELSVCALSTKYDTGRRQSTGDCDTLAARDSTALLLHVELFRYLNEVFEILVDRILAFVGQMCEPHLIDRSSARSAAGAVELIKP